jgi:DNA-binding transcriptional regulator YdaS (Cro superfamily)
VKLEKWIDATTTTQLKKLAKKCGCHSNYLYQVATKGCSAGLAKKIERWTKKLTPERVVSKNELRPDIWGRGE